MRALRLGAAAMSSSLSGSMSLPPLPWQESQNMQVTVGGIQGFSDLADPGNIAQLLATGRVSIYMHWAAMYEGAYNVDWIPGVNAYGLLPKIADVFAGTGGGVLEINDDPGQTDAEINSYFQGILVGAVEDQGFHPGEININLDAGATYQNSVDEFQKFITIGQSYG